MRFFNICRYDLPLHFVLLLTNWLPDMVICLRLRGRLARPFLKNCGKSIGIGRDVTFYNPSNITIGDNVYIAKGCWLSATDSIVIEDEVLLGPYVTIASSNHSRLNGSFRYGKAKKGSVLIRKGSWLGAHAVVTKGSTLGEGSVLAANSVLIGSSESQCLYAGLPAKKIKCQR